MYGWHVGEEDALAALQKLAESMLHADEFYSSLGGIIGYQAKCLELIGNKGAASSTEASTQDVQVECFFLS